jgi:hypothetical protein
LEDRGIILAHQDVRGKILQDMDQAHEEILLQLDEIQLQLKEIKSKLSEQDPQDVVQPPANSLPQIPEPAQGSDRHLSINFPVCLIFFLILDLFLSTMLY